MSDANCQSGEIGTFSAKQWRVQQKIKVLRISSLWNKYGWQLVSKLWIGCERRKMCMFILLPKELQTSQSDRAYGNDNENYLRHEPKNSLALQSKLRSHFKMTCIA